MNYQYCPRCRDYWPQDKMVETANGEICQGCFDVQHRTEAKDRARTERMIEAGVLTLIGELDYENQTERI